MKVVVCFVLASIFVHSVKTLKSKQVNLALETVLNFDKKDREADLAVIDKVQDFLDQIKHAMRRGNARRSTKHDVKFTDFILEAARILKDYDDINLEDAYVIINDESRRYVNKESEFRDLFGSKDMRRFVSDQLDEAKEMSADELRKNLDSAISFIESHKKTGEKNNLLDIGNTLYEGASDKFLVALRNLDNLRRNGEINLERVLKDTLRTLVFEHYTNLNDRVRDELINMVKHYWRAFADIKNRAQTKSKTADVTRFRHEEKGKRHKHRTSSPRERKRSSKTKLYEKHLKDKPLTSFERFNKKDKNKHEVFVTDRELKKLLESHEEPEQVKPKSRFTVYKDEDKPYRNYEVKKTGRSKHRMGRVSPTPPLLHGRGKKHDRTEDGAQDISELSDASEPRVLMGGQVMRDVHFRGKSSGDEESENSDRAEGASSTEEILIQHSNIVDIGLSRKSPGRINITFVSSETHKKDRSKENPGSVSTSMETKVIRKSNVNDTLEIPTPNEPLNVDILIQKIEKEIEDVRDQVEYIKNLTKIQSSDHNETVSNVTTINITVTETPKEDSGFAFRAQEDSDVSSTEVEIESKRSIKQITTTVPSDATDAKAINENKMHDAVENASEIINVNNNTNVDKSIERDTGDASQAHYTEKVNDEKMATDAKLKSDDNEEENAITESSINSTTSLLVDIRLNA